MTDKKLKNRKKKVGQSQRHTRAAGKNAIRDAATRIPDNEGKIHNVRVEARAKIGSRQCSHFALSDDDHVWWPEAEVGKYLTSPGGLRGCVILDYYQMHGIPR